jgi:two-component system, NtrC family, response regulator AtoC
MRAPRILVVDDEPDMVDACGRILRRAGYRCLTTSDLQRALAFIESERPDLVLIKLKMPAVDGLALLRRAHEVDPALPVVVITAVATIESAVAAIKQGAFDYLPKNFLVDQLTAIVERALRQRRLAQENRALREQLQMTLGLERVIGRSPAMAQLFELVKKAAPSEANILVSGESGTGKELIARAIHANSRRASQALVPVDCASLPEHLLESELFGHEKGAFSDAVKTKPGLMEIAAGGTLFLDEIAELAVGLQVKLLRALQERQIRRLGGSSLIDVDVRIVSATSRNLRAAVAKGRFREELYYRINVIEIGLPPLRERPGDVRLLAHAFFKRYGQDRIRSWDDAAMAALEAYAWPGNVRELQNAIERACALAEGGTITRRDLPDHVLNGARHAVTPAAACAPIVASQLAGTTTLGLRDARERWMAVLEASYLRRVLECHRGNVSAAATAAGIDRKTFYRLINKHRIAS